MMALQLPRESYTELPSATFKNSTLLNEESALFPKDSTFAGSSKEVNPLQLKKAFSSIEVTDSGMVTDVILIVLSNAYFPIFTTV